MKGDVGVSIPPMEKQLRGGSMGRLQWRGKLMRQIIEKMEGNNDIKQWEKNAERRGPVSSRRKTMETIESESETVDIKQWKKMGGAIRFYFRCSHALGTATRDSIDRESQKLG